MRQGKVEGKESLTVEGEGEEEEEEEEACWASPRAFEEEVRRRKRTV